MATTKQPAGKANDRPDAIESAPSTAASPDTPEPKQRATQRRGRTRRATRRATLMAKSTGPTKAARRKRRSSRTGKRHTPAERERILATARREGLSGPKAAKRFGISEVTYYLWRKNARPAIHQAARQVRKSGVIDLASDIQRQLEHRIRELIPAVVRREVDSIMADLTPTGRRGRRRSK